MKYLAFDVKLNLKLPTLHHDTNVIQLNSKPLVAQLIFERLGLRGEGAIRCE